MEVATHKFFQKLSERLYKENHLSDITWTLCETCSEFKILFLSFFFTEITDASDIILKREFTKGDSRPDLHFEFNNKIHIIEVKIDDRFDHIKQYKKDFPEVRFGWIARYTHKSDEKDVVIKTWKDFKNCIEKRVEEEISQDAKSLINAYSTYLSEVCRIIKFKKMELNKNVLLSLYHFNESVEEIIEEGVDGFKMKSKSKQNNMGNDWSGKYFDLSKKGSKIKIQSWFGIMYNEYKVCISVCFEEEFCKIVYSKLIKNKASQGKYYITEPEPDEKCFFYTLQEDWFNNFNQANSVEEQKKILTEFFNEIIQDISQYL
jgi:hypothetical protein